MVAVSIRSYTLKVCEYRGSKFLSTSKEHSSFEEMADIGRVEEDKKAGNKHQCMNAFKVDERCTCGRRKLPQQVPLMSQMQKEVNLTEDDPELRQCVKCHKTQCLEELGVNIGVQLVMKSLPDRSVTLRAFGKTVQEIAEVSSVAEVTGSMLLKATKFDVVYSEGIVQSVKRIQSE